MRELILNKVEKFVITKFLTSVERCHLTVNIHFPNVFFLLYVARWLYFKSLRVQAVPATGRGDPQSFEALRLPHFLDNLLTDGAEVVSLTRRAIPVTGRGSQ
jgi:hypothetical protein